MSTANTDPAELRRRLVESLLAFERADSDLVRIEAAREARERAEELEHATIAEGRAAKISWAKIGTVYGLTKQGAQQRFGHPQKNVAEEPTE